MHFLKNIIDTNQPFGICFSGGSDSIAVAHYLKHKNPTLYHFNHKYLKEDDEIENRAKEAARDLGLRFVSSQSLNKYIKGSVEDYCRGERYKWFSTIGGNLITCHQLSDSCESYIFNCLRGCPEYIPIPISSTFGVTTIVRPFIITPKKVIDEYIHHNNLTHLIAHDYLNDDIKIMRVWIRKKLLPEIKDRTNIEKVVKKKYLKKLLDNRD